jgi:hypothetical protein
MAMTPADLIERVYRDAVAMCKRGDREPPDNGRRGQFKRGWRDATIRGQHYGDDTLAVLTWCNLGYRFGRELRVPATEEIDRVWDHVSTIYLIRSARAREDDRASNFAIHRTGLALSRRRVTARVGRSGLPRNCG